MITREEYNEIPDSVLLMIAKKARNNMERHEIVDLLDEVVLRYARTLGSDGCRTASEATKEFIENTSMSDIIPPVEEDGGWIPWSGGKCSLPKNTLVEVKCNDGVTIDTYPAGRWSWKHHGNCFDIVAYRVVE